MSLSRFYDRVDRATTWGAGSFVLAGLGPPTLFTLCLTYGCQPVETLVMHEQLHAPSDGSGSQQETGPASPFPGVKPFGPEHRSVFFGRHRDVAGLREMISDKSFRAGVVYGEAGVGKTSCLRAGLVSQLQAAGLHAIYLRCRANLKKELADQAMDAGATPAMPDEDVADYVVRLGRSLRGGLVLLLDDVADLLAPDAPRVDAEPLLRLVSRLGGAEPGSAKVLFCVDSDEYHLIAELQRRAHVTIAPASIYHLAKLDKEECTKVIEQAALASGIYFEAGMAALVAQDLTQQGPASRQRALSQSNARIVEPPCLR